MQIRATISPIAATYMTLITGLHCPIPNLVHTSPLRLYTRDIYVILFMKRINVNVQHETTKGFQ